MIEEEELGFLDAITKQPNDQATRLVYADWLEERSDARADLIRLHMALQTLSPDDARRVGAEHDLSLLRKGVDPSWLHVIERERAYLKGPRMRGCLACDAADAYEEDANLAGDGWSRTLHTDAQDTECDAWKRLLQLVDDAAADGRTTFAPLRDLEVGDIPFIVTLPRTIAKLTSVKELVLYGSDLVRIPPEIGMMRSLERFTPYTSYKLHWFPYEITRCTNLRDSTVSTRAIYGNFKFRSPFPQLRPGPFTTASHGVSPLEHSMLRSCSVCGAPFEDLQLHRVWISLRVATDVLPLLVNACSEQCIARLPRGAERHLPGAHRGGADLIQPERC